MQNNDWQAWFSEACDRLAHGGAFLMAGKNPMTIGWCSFGVLWGRPSVTIYVRKSRYSHGLLDGGAFAVSFPGKGELKEALAFCGSRSGRDVDKLAALNLSVTPAKTVDAYTLDGCRFHFECRELGRTEFEPANMDQSVIDRFYGGRREQSDDIHTVIYAEILAAYRAE